MSLPENLTYGGAYGTDTAPAIAFTKVDYGKYVPTVQSDEDQQILTFIPNINYDGKTSSIKIEYVWNKSAIGTDGNAGGFVPGGAIPPNQFLKIATHVYAPMGSNVVGKFTQADIVGSLLRHAQLFSTPGLCARLARAER